MHQHVAAYDDEMHLEECLVEFACTADSMVHCAKHEHQWHGGGDHHENLDQQVGIRPTLDQKEQIRAKHANTCLNVTSHSRSVCRTGYCLSCTPPLPWHARHASTLEQVRARRSAVHVASARLLLVLLVQTHTQNSF